MAPSFSFKTWWGKPHRVTLSSLVEAFAMIPEAIADYGIAGVDPRVGSVRGLADDGPGAANRLGVSAACSPDAPRAAAGDGGLSVEMLNLSRESTDLFARIVVAPEACGSGESLASAH